MHDNLLLANHRHAPQAFPEDDRKYVLPTTASFLSRHSARSASQLDSYSPFNA